MKAKPWRYGLLTAPSDFPIYKTDAEVEAEKDSVLKNFEPYFRMDATVENTEVDKLRTAYNKELNKKATPAYMQYIENSLVCLYKNGIIAPQELENLKKDNYARVNLLENNVAHSRYASDFFTVKNSL